jgi:O-antigen/teichoic acid export membrane protein
MTPDPTSARSVTRTIFKSTVMLTVADLMTRLTTLVVTFMISRRLGAAGLGIYATATATYSLIAVAGGLGATNYMVREIAKKPDETGRFFAHVAALGTVLAIVVMIGFWLILPHLGYSAELSRSMTIIIIALIPGTLNTIMRSVFVAHQRVVFITYTVAVAAIINIVVSWWMLTAGYSVAVLLLAFVIGQTVVMLLGLAVIHTRIAPLRLKLSWPYSKIILREIRTFAVLSLLAAVFAQPEILMMSALASETQVGYFGAAFRIVSFWMIVPSVLMTNVFPFMAKSVGEVDRTLRLQHTSVKYLLLVTLPIAAGTAAAAGPIIRMFYGSGFEQAVLPLQIMSMLLVFNALDQVYWRALAARNEQRNDLIVRLISAVFRIVVGLILISRLGVTGGAWSALTSVALGALLLAYFVQRDGTPLKITALGLRSAGASALMAVAVWAASDRLSIVPLVALGAAAYALLVWVLRVLDDRDKEMIGSVLRRRRAAKGTSG